MTPPVQPILPPKAAPKKVVSPYYMRYLYEQEMAIRARGGDDSAVDAFFGMEDEKPFSGQVNGPTVDQLLGDETPTNLRGVSMAALQGATFGFGDEALGAILGIATGVGARRGIDDYRREYDTWAKDHRKASIAAEIGGGLLTLPFTGGAGAVKSVGGAIRVGALSGAAYGAGNAEGGVGERTLGALGGAVVGGVTAGVLGGIGSWVVKPLVQQAAATSLGKAVIAPIERKVAQTFGSEVLALTPEARARQKLAAALDAENIDFDELENRLLDLHLSGINASVLDAGGDELLTLANEVTKDRSPLKTKLIQDLLARQAGEKERVVARLLGEAVRRENRFGIANATEAVDVLHEQGLAASKPFYEAAHEQTMKLTPRLRKFLLEEKAIREGYNLGAESAQLADRAGRGHGLYVKTLGDNIDDIMRKAGIPEEAIARTGNLKFGEATAELPIRGVDYMQRGLHRVIKKGLRDGGLSAEDAKALLSIRDEFVAEARRQSPDFEKAQLLYSGKIKSRDAVLTGRKFIRMEPGAIAKHMEKLNPNERDFARLGFVQEVYNNIMKSNSPSVSESFFGANLFGKKSYRMEQIRALFPDAPEAADAFARQLAGEVRASYTTGRAVSLPSTSAAQKLEQQAMGSLPHGASTRSLIASGTRSALQRLRAAMTKDEADELTHLFGKGLRRSADDTGVMPRELEVLLDDLRYSYEGIKTRAKVRGVASRIVGQKPGAVADAALNAALSVIR